MKPGMIITNYKTVKESLPLDSEYDKKLNSDIFIEKAREEYDNIIEKANKEYQSIIKKANHLLITVENLKTSIENNYIESIKENYTLDSQSFLDKKNEEFNNLINEFNKKFDNLTLKAQDDIYSILLTTFESFFSDEYKNPENIKKLIYNNFDNFDNSKKFELVLSENLYKEFNDNFKVEIENDLNIQLNEIKHSKKLNGFIMNTDLGSIECDLDKQIQSLKEQLNISM